MRSCHRRKSIILLTTLIFVMQASSTVAGAMAKPSRKLGKITSDSAMSQIPAAPGAAKVLVGPQISVSGSPVPIAPALTPLFAMAILSMLAQQASFGGSSFSPPFTPNNGFDTGSFSEPEVVAEPATDVGDTPVPESISETITESIPATVPQATPVAKAPVADEVKSPTLNQCFNHEGAGKKVGKSAGALSIGQGACNGEVIAMDYIITNSHCMERSNGSLKAVFGLGAGESKRAFRCKGIAARNPRDRLDYAIVKCPGIGKYFPPVEIADRRPQIGEPIRVATHNFSRNGGVKKLTQIGAVVSSRPYGYLGDSMVSSAYSEPGNSGSGIYDKQGKWIGLLCLLWGGPTDGGGSPSFFSPADKIVRDLKNRFPQVARQIKSDAEVVASCQVEAAGTLVADRKPAQSKVGLQ